MEIHVLDRFFNCEGDMVTLQSTFSEIAQFIDRENLFFSSIQIDGEDFNEDVDIVEYLGEHAGHIQKVNVLTVTPKQMMDDTFIMMQDYLARALPDLKVLVGKFYRDVSQEEWASFQDFLEALQWIFKSNEPLFVNERFQGIYSSESSVKRAVQAIQDKVKLLEEALVQADYTLLADVLQYEVLPGLEQLQQQLEQTIDLEVVKRDLI